MLNIENTTVTKNDFQVKSRNIKHITSSARSNKFTKIIRKLN